MMNFLIIGLAFCWVLTSAPAHAKIYKWKDEKGKTHFTNDPTKVPKSQNTEVETSQELMAPAPVETPDLPQIEDETSAEKSEEGKESLEEIYERFKIERPEKKQSPERERESDQKLLNSAEQARERQLKKIKELEKLNHKPAGWTTDKSLEETIKDLQEGVEKSDQDIKRYKEKLNPAISDN